MTETEPGDADLVEEISGEAPEALPKRPDEPVSTHASDAPAEPAAGTAPTSSAGPQARDSGFLPRHPKALTLSLIVGGIVTAIVAGVLFLVVLLVILIAGFDSPPAAAVLTLAVVVIGTVSFLLLALPRWRHQRYRYCADQGGLRIHRGVWWRSRIHVPRSRLQHTDIAQGPLERRLGLASLVVHTAGTHASSTRLSGLSFEAAVAVRELLTGEEEDLTDGV